MDSTAGQTSGSKCGTCGGRGLHRSSSAWPVGHRCHRFMCVSTWSCIGGTDRHVVWTPPPPPGRTKDVLEKGVKDPLLPSRTPSHCLPGGKCQVQWH